MKRSVRLASARPLVKVLGALHDAHPAVRYSASNSTITAAASNDTVVMAVSAQLPAAVSHSETVVLPEPPTSQGPVTLTTSGWMAGDTAAKDLHTTHHRKLSCATPAHWRELTLDAAVLGDVLEGYRAAPDARNVIFDTHSPVLTVSVNGPIVRGMSTLRPPLTAGGAGTTIGVPLDAAIAAFALFDGPVLCRFGRTAMTISGTQASGQDCVVTFSSLRDVSAAEVPDMPSPKNRRRHDVRINLDTWPEFAAPARRSLLDQVPTAHLRIRGAGDFRTLSVDTRAGSSSRHIDIACSTSDRFSVDLPWPVLVAVLSPALKAVSATAGIRVFDPNPRLTPLVVTYRGEHADGWVASPARKPVISAA